MWAWYGTWRRLSRVGVEELHLGFSWIFHSLLLSIQSMPHIWAAEGRRDRRSTGKWSELLVFCFCFLFKQVAPCSRGDIPGLLWWFSLEALTCDVRAPFPFIWLVYLSHRPWLSRGCFPWAHTIESSHPVSLIWQNLESIAQLSPQRCLCLFMGNSYFLLSKSVWAAISKCLILSSLLKKKPKHLFFILLRLGLQDQSAGMFIVGWRIRLRIAPISCWPLEEEVWDLLGFLLQGH